MVKLATRPEKRVGTDEMWDHAEGVMATVLGQIEAKSHKNGSRPRSIPGKGRSTGRSSNMCCVTPSVAIGNAARPRSIQPAGKIRHVLYRCRRPEENAGDGPSRNLRIDGAFLGILIEHYAGNFPLWLAPIQAVVTTITSEATNTPRWSGRRAARGLRAEMDLRNEKIN